MKTKIIKGAHKKQAQYQLSQLLGFHATIADLKILWTFYILFKKFPTVFPADLSVATWAGDYCRDTTQAFKDKIDGSSVPILDWTRKDHAPTPTYFWLLDPEKTEKFRQLFLIVFGYLDIKILRNPHHQIIPTRLLKLTMLATITCIAPDISGTPRRPAGMTFAETLCLQNRGIRTDGSKNSLNKQQFFDLFDRRPVFTGTVVYPGHEATTQKHQGQPSLKQESNASTIQPNTALHSRDRRDAVIPLGPDQTYGISRGGDRRCPQSTTTQQSGPRSIFAVFHSSKSVLPDEQYRAPMGGSRLSQVSVQDAREGTDDIAYGYEGNWEEIMD